MAPILVGFSARNQRDRTLDPEGKPKIPPRGHDEFSFLALLRVLRVFVVRFSI
jgi:hypothetical protein